MYPYLEWSLSWYPTHSDLKFKLYLTKIYLRDGTIKKPLKEIATVIWPQKQYFSKPELQDPDISFLSMQ